MDLIKSLNPSCLDLGYADEEPCMLHIGIWCMDRNDCESLVELEYDTKMPKRVYSG